MTMEAEYTVNVGNLKVSGSAKDLHKLVNIYDLASCEYGHEIVDEIHGKHRDTLIAELETEQKEIETIKRQIINTIRDSDYYKEYSSKALVLLADILEEIENEKKY